MAASAQATGAPQRTAPQRTSAFAFVQPVAMGVLLGQGWHVYSEVYARGSLVGFAACCCGAAVGLLAGVVLSGRAASGQAALRLSFFWMSCTLNGGLSGIAQLRLRTGRFRGNDDAIVVNSFLSSGLLGTSLPHIALKVVRQPGAEVLLPCVLAVLLTEAICSSETVPGLQVGVSLFLLVVGLHGITSDAGLPDGIRWGEASRSGDRNSGNANSSGSTGPSHEPFFPATAMDKRCYSPHFLVSRKPHSVPNGTNVVPLISLVTRQASESSRGGGERGKGGGKDRGAKESRSNRKHSDEAASGSTQLAPAPSRATAPQDVEEMSRQKAAASTSEVGSDIRWDILFEEMQRVDGGKALPSDAERCPLDATTANKDVLEVDGPIEVFAELSAECAAEDEGEWGGEEDLENCGDEPSGDREVLEQEAPAKPPLDMLQRLEEALAHARELEAAEATNEGPAEESTQMPEAPSSVAPGEVLERLEADPADTEEPLCDVVAAPLEADLEPEDDLDVDVAVAQVLRHDDETGEDHDVPWRQAINDDRNWDHIDRQDHRRPWRNKGSSRSELHLEQLEKCEIERQARENCEHLPVRENGLQRRPPGSGLVLTELSGGMGTRDHSDSHEPEDLDLTLDDDAFEPSASHPDATELSALQSSAAKLNAAAPEFVPVEAEFSVPKAKLRADAAAFQPGAGADAAEAASSLSLFADEPVRATVGGDVAGAPIAARGTVEDEVYPELPYAPSGPWAGHDEEWDNAHATAAASYAGDSWDKPWDGYNYGGAAVAGAWDGYVAYGDASNHDYASYGYEAAGVANGTGAYLNMSAEAAEFVPSMWGGQDEMPVVGCHEEQQEPESVPNEHDPAESLLDPEAPDPGCGRASEVRRPDPVEDRKGKGGKSRTSRDAQPRTLWVGDVDPRMSEAFISELFASMALVTSVKIMRDRGYGDRFGYAFVELASHSAAEGVLEALKGEPIVAQDGRKLRVNWASENQSGGSEGWNSDGRFGSARGSDGREDAQKGDRRLRRDRDGRRVEKGDFRGYYEAYGKGSDGREAYWDAGSRGKGDGRRNNGKSRGGDDDPSERNYARTDARSDAQSGAESRVWAYIDPKGEVQMGFTMEEMRTWYQVGYFESDLSVAVAQEGPGRKIRTPSRREFYKLRQWFPDLDKAFTYLPKF